MLRILKFIMSISKNFRQPKASYSIKLKCFSFGLIQKKPNWNITRIPLPSPLWDGHRMKILIALFHLCILYTHFWTLYVLWVAKNLWISWMSMAYTVYMVVGNVTILSSLLFLNIMKFKYVSVQCVSLMPFWCVCVRACLWQIHVNLSLFLFAHCGRIWLVIITFYDFLSVSRHGFFLSCVYPEGGLS